MNTQTIEECMKASFASTPFPQVVQRLIGAGVASYTADLVKLRKTYYGAAAEAHDEAMPLDGGPQIARVLGVTRQNVQRIADLLVAEGSAEYQDNPDHRASPHLVLTKRGRAALDQLTKAAGGYHARLARKLSPSDIASIHRGLSRLLEALNAIDPVNPSK